MEKISVVVPVYCNSLEKEGYLKQALLSVCNQTVSNIELIIIDDASPRDISGLVKEISEKIFTVYRRNELNIRQAASRNLGVSLCTGDFIALLDHDDVWFSDKLEKQYNILQSDLDIGMTFCDLNFLCMDGDVNSNILKVDRRNIPEYSDFITLFRRGNYIITASSVMLRRSVLEAIGGFDIRYSSMDDFDAWLKISLISKIKFISETLLEYRIHSSNANASVDLLLDSKLLYKIYLDRFVKFSGKKKMLMLPKLFKKTLALAYYAIQR